MDLKAYTLGNNGLVHADVIAALDERPHIQQAKVIVVAASKAAATRLLETLRPWVPCFRVSNCQWNPETVDSMFAAVGGQPGVVVMGLDLRPGSPVLLIEQTGPRRVGHLERNGYSTVFVPTRTEE